MKKETSYSSIAKLFSRCHIHNPERNLLHIQLHPLYKMYLRFIEFHYLALGYCVKIVQKWGFSGAYFPVLGLNTEIYGVNFRFESEYGQTRTRKTPYLDTFHAVRSIHFF